MANFACRIKTLLCPHDIFRRRYRRMYALKMSGNWFEPWVFLRTMCERSLVYGEGIHESMEMFTKDVALPVELRLLPYDINSVMHFGERDFSKNGHRTILFKNRNSRQNRVGLSPLDLRRIELVYGEKCRQRDREEKIELCQSYPGVARRKRHADTELRSLRVNPEITPPPSVVPSDDTPTLEPNDDIKELGIEDEVQVIVEHTYKMASLAVKNARSKYCDDKQNITREDKKKNSTDLLEVIAIIADYAKSVVDKAVANLTVLCDDEDDIGRYSRQRCNWGDNSYRCRQTYRSTKSGAVRASTQHRPSYYQSTKHEGYGKRVQYHMRSGNDTEDAAEETRIENDEPVTSPMGEVVKEAESGTTDLKEGVRIKREVANRVEEDVVKADSKEVDGVENLRSKREVEDAVLTDLKGDDTNNLLENIESSRQKRSLASLTEQAKEENIPEVIKNEEFFSVKREVTDKVESKTEIVVLKPNTTAVMEDRKNCSESILVAIENVTNAEVQGLKAESKSPQMEGQQFFQGRRFRVKNPKGNVRNEWDSSEVSMEMMTSPKHERPHPLYSSDREQEIRNREMENSKMKVHRLEKERRRKKRPQKPEEHQERGKLVSVPKQVPLTKLNQEFYSERKWPGGIIRYVISPNPLYDLDAVRQRLQEVNDILQRRTCVRLIEITEDQANNYEDYLLIDTSPDYVTGRVGGKQNFGSIELFRGGQHRQHAAMMVMAMLGFYFEVARHDRDKYIRVHMRHVRPDKLHHFEKIRAEATLAVPYDYRSATHPAWQFWRKIGKTGISTVATFKEQDPDGSVMKSLGQHSQLLSDIDIIKINSVYGVKCFHNTQRKGRKGEAKGGRVREQ